MRAALARTKQVLRQLLLAYGLHLLLFLISFSSEAISQLAHYCVFFQKHEEEKVVLRKEDVADSFLISQREWSMTLLTYHSIAVMMRRHRHLASQTGS